MRRIALISALLIVVGVAAYRIQAQPDPIVEGRASQPAPASDPFAPSATARESTLFGPPAEPFDAEARVSAIVSEFSKALNSALHDKVITDQQAKRLLKDLEVSLTVKRARLDLLRVKMLLEGVGKDAAGVPGLQEANELRQQLPGWRELEPVTERSGIFGSDLESKLANPRQSAKIPSR